MEKKKNQLGAIHRVQKKLTALLHILEQGVCGECSPTNGLAN